MEHSFNHELSLQLRFNDIDSLGHVNNSVYFNFFDLGKVRYFEEVRNENIDWRKADIVVANINANFLAPVFLNEPIAVQTTVTEIGNKSFQVLQQIINASTRQVKCVCATVMVGFDIKTNTAKEISAEWKEAICRYEGRDLMR